MGEQRMKKISGAMESTSGKKTNDIDKVLETKKKAKEIKTILKKEKNVKEIQAILEFEKNREEIKKEIEAKNKIEKSMDRLEIVKEIERLEREGLFDVDPEKDPPTIVLPPEKVDYLRKKYSSKIKSKVSYALGKKFLEDLLKENKLMIKEVNGFENLENLETGAVITCNHFNPFDSFTVEMIFRSSKHYKKKKRLYKVIREGNYTNFPGFYGFLFRNCYTLPLSSNKRTMIEFMKAVDTLLQRNEFVLIFPEQSMWWNYRKPKPLKNGAFRIAIRNKVPILPIFITMEDSDIIGEDGWPIQKYIVNIEKPIYLEEALSPKENEEKMKKENFQVWKNIYESFYKIPLEYTTEKK